MFGLIAAFDDVDCGLNLIEVFLPPAYVVGGKVMFPVVSVWLFPCDHYPQCQSCSLGTHNTSGPLCINEAHTSIGKWVFGFRLKSFFGIGLPVMGKVLK